MALDHLEQLEAEAIYILREISASFKNVALLFSGGKDSTVLAHLARTAFYPAPIKLTFVHVDTGHNFPETLAFRDQLARELGVKLVVAEVIESIRAGSARDETGPGASRNSIQSITLMEATSRHGFDALIGGARRDEEKARAKERIFSHRNLFGVWDPKNQRPELWNIFNTNMNAGDHFRIFPLSNWTELDIWEYIERRNISLPSLYFAHEREVFKRAGAYYAYAPYLELYPNEVVTTEVVRFRTMGDLPCTGGELSSARTLSEVIAEIKDSPYSERGFRADDKRSQTAMEDRKKNGYF